MSKNEIVFGNLGKLTLRVLLRRQRWIVYIVRTRSVEAVEVETTVNKSEIGMASGKKGPAFKIHESIQELLLGSGKFNDKDIVQLLRELPRKWERHGNLIIIPHDALRSECWKILGLYF